MPGALCRPAIRGVIAAVLLGVAACAPTGPGTQGAPTGSVGHATIVAIRPVIVRGQDMLLRAVAGAAVPAVGSAVEFIVREADGRIISVVQSNQENFRPGDRVVLTRGDRTRIVRVHG